MLATRSARAPDGSGFRTDVHEAIREIVARAENSGSPISLTELGDSLTRAFPNVYVKISRAAGYANLTQMVQDNPFVCIQGTPPKEVLMTKPKP